MPLHLFYTMYSGLCSGGGLLAILHIHPTVPNKQKNSDEENIMKESIYRINLGINN